MVARLDITAHHWKDGLVVLHFGRVEGSERKVLSSVDIRCRRSSEPTDGRHCTACIYPDNFTCSPGCRQSDGKGSIKLPSVLICFSGRRRWMTWIERGGDGATRFWCSHVSGVVLIILRIAN